MMTCFIELPDGYDASNIIQDSVILNNTVCAEKVAVGDYDRDGIPDLTVKFDREQVCALFKPGDAVEFTVSGAVGDVRFSGTDTVRVTGKKNGNKKIVIPECYEGRNTDRVYFYHLNHLGTPQAMTDEAGNIVWQADYKPFGEVIVTASSVENSFRFPGQFYDAETGLHYNWHRYYDPDTGRYLMPDPIGVDGGINLFVYALGDPANVSDPSGLDPVDPNTGERSEVMGCHHTEKLPEGAVGLLLILLDIADFPSGEGIGPGIAIIYKAGTTGTEIGKKSIIEGFRVSNHAWRKSGLGRGATEELVKSVIQEAKKAGTVITETGTGKFAGNTIKIYEHSGIKVAIDETRKLILSIRPLKGFKLP